MKLKRKKFPPGLPSRDESIRINNFTKTLTLRAGFEPAREDPIGFQVQRLNHSAITAYTLLNKSTVYSRVNSKRVKLSEERNQHTIGKRKPNQVNVVQLLSDKS